MLVNEEVKRIARELGFDACGLAPAEALPAVEQARFDQWITEGNQAGMLYMENHRTIRFDPEGLVPGAHTIISVALNYYPEERRDPADPYIAYYAYGKDYHLVLKERLRQLWQALLRQRTEEREPEARLFTDSAPLLERYWAWRAGLGWIGKNTCLILPGKGSFFFLGEIVTTAKADRYDEPMGSHCGSCHRCLDACPTGALAAPFRLDARHCLSYLTIEHRGELPPREAGRLGNRLYGCDSCQSACPWNRFAQPTAVEAFRPSADLLALKKDHLKMLTREEYNRIFARSAVKRVKYEGLRRTIDYLFTCLNK